MNTLFPQILVGSLVLDLETLLRPCSWAHLLLPPQTGQTGGLIDGTGRGSESLLGGLAFSPRVPLGTEGQPAVPRSVGSSASLHHSDSRRPKALYSFEPLGSPA